ncbi:uncharacterized protein [Nicotiana sylvestris]|uniref:uncharacterized protein n=1 Tax=Nicotiana sylvestris TaxID=4096 RepID=UPI00388CAC7C
MIEKHKQWHEKLSFTLLGYRTTVHTSTGETPYMLVYGIEAVIPAEVEIPSLRIIYEAKLDHAEWVKNCYERLALIDGKRMNAVCHGQLYQNRMSRSFNKRVKPRQFTPGQLHYYVLLLWRLSNSNPIFEGKRVVLPNVLNPILREKKGCMTLGYPFLLNGGVVDTVTVKGVTTSTSNGVEVAADGATSTSNGTDVVTSMSKGA